MRALRALQPAGLTAHGRQSGGGGARGPYGTNGRREDGGKGFGDWSNFTSTFSSSGAPTAPERGAHGPPEARGVGARVVSSAGIAGTVTPEPKRRRENEASPFGGKERPTISEPLPPTPEGIPRQLRPGGEETGEAHQRRMPSALDQTLAAGNPLDHQLKKALKNYEVFYRMERGTAKVDNLRDSDYSIGTWA